MSLLGLRSKVALVSTIVFWLSLTPQLLSRGCAGGLPPNYLYFPAGSKPVILLQGPCSLWDFLFFFVRVLALLFLLHPRLPNAGMMPL